MTINLLHKLYKSWCKKEKFKQILSADEMLLSSQVKYPYQSYWLKNFIRIWNKCEDINYKRYFKKKGSI